MGVFSNSEAAHHEAEWTEDLFLALGKPGRKLVVSMLDGMENMRLNMAVMNEEGRAALMEAYKGTVIKGFRFPHPTLPEKDRDFVRVVVPLDEQSDEDKEYVCDGLEWALDKEIDVRDFTLSIPGIKNEERHLTALLYNSNKRPLWEDNAEVAGVLISHGANPEACDAQNSTPLHVAAFRGFTDLARTLVKDCKVDVDAVNANFVTPLRCAVHGGHEKTVRVLIEEFGARLDVLSGGGRTTLHLAALDNQVAIAKMLFEEYGPAVDAQDKGGMTPRDLAREQHGEDSEIYQLLLSHSVQA